MEKQGLRVCRSLWPFLDITIESVVGAMGNDVQKQIGKKATIGITPIEVIEYLGEGGYSYIFLVSSPTGEEYVLKRMVASTREDVEQTKQEVDLIKRLNHPQIVKYVDSNSRSLSKQTLETIIIMEYCQEGHLLEQLRKRATNHYTERELLELYRTLATPIAYLHHQDPPIAHRDIKPENYLRTAEGVYKLCDFGSAAVGSRSVRDKMDRNVESERIEKTTTPLYQAPELADIDGHAMFGTGVLDEKVDIWALGCVFYTAAFLKPPFAAEGLRSDRYKIPKDSPYSKGIIQLLSFMLEADVEERSSIDHVLYCIEALLAGQSKLLKYSQWSRETSRSKGKKPKANKTQPATLPGQHQVISSTSSKAVKQEAPLLDLFDFASPVHVPVASFTTPTVNPQRHPPLTSASGPLFDDFGFPINVNAGATQSVSFGNSPRVRPPEESSEHWNPFA